MKITVTFTREEFTLLIRTLEDLPSGLWGPLYVLSQRLDVELCRADEAAGMEPCWQCDECGDGLTPRTPPEQEQA